MDYEFYVAGPLFNAYERAYQKQLATALSPLGRVFLPQEDVVQTSEERAIHDACLQALDQSRLVVANLSGQDVDSGTAFEVGYAAAQGKPIYAVRSELAFPCADRTSYPNLMLKYSVRLFPTVEALVQALSESDLL